MIVKKISYSTSQIQAASGVSQEIPAVFSFRDTINENNIYYRPKLMYVANDSGETVGVCPMTEIEYINYVASGGAVSEFFPIKDSANYTFDNLKREITRIVVSGVAGASAGLDVIFQYE